ncbi:hypothetical protein EVAR_102599_1 [Eumeta japonica]|uniref:Uncharacterized protein n=1 Tax=Eumeta variegata TaxID=151549 RepID=A0A4C1TUP2_EUMVA|nr:hypothetical protein EVAR_102599_1 [Eumeta japonica]
MRSVNNARTRYFASRPRPARAARPCTAPLDLHLEQVLLPAAANGSGRRLRSGRLSRPRPAGPAGLVRIGGPQATVVTDTVTTSEAFGTPTDAPSETFASARVKTVVDGFAVGRDRTAYFTIRKRPSTANPPPSKVHRGPFGNVAQPQRPPCVNTQHGVMPLKRITLISIPLTYIKAVNTRRPYFCLVSFAERGAISNSSVGMRLRSGLKESPVKSSRPVTLEVRAARVGRTLRDVLHIGHLRVWSPAGWSSRTITRLCHNLMWMVNKVSDTCRYDFFSNTVVLT